MEILQSLQVVHACRLTHMWQKDDALLNDVKSTDQVYDKLSKEKTHMISETITLPRFIDNRKFNLYKSSETNSALSDTETLIYTFKLAQLVMNMIEFSSRDCIALNYLPQIINNVRKF